jgi:hypothetical protein
LLSVLLMSLEDTDGYFIWLGFGTAGKWNDLNVFKLPNFVNILKSNYLLIPGSRLLPHGEERNCNVFFTAGFRLVVTFITALH